MDEAGAEILFVVLAIIVLVVGIAWKFTRRGEDQQPTRGEGISESGRFDARTPSPTLVARLRARAPLALKIYGWIFTIMALAGSLGIGARTWMRYDLLHSRSQTQARILSNEIYSEQYWAMGSRYSRAGWRVRYGFRCAVNYSVDGRTYESLADLGVKSNFRNSLEKWPSRLPPGTDVTVAYDPVDPTQVLLAGDFQIAYAPVVFGIWLCAFLFLLGALLLTVSRRLQLSTSPVGNL